MLTNRLLAKAFEDETIKFVKIYSPNKLGIYLHNLFCRLLHHNLENKVQGVEQKEAKTPTANKK